MAVTVANVTIVDATTLLVTFSGPVCRTAELFVGSNFAIREKPFGKSPITVKEITPEPGTAYPTQVTLKLNDYIVIKGIYALALSNILGQDGEVVSSDEFNFIENTGFALPGPPQPPASPFVPMMRGYLFRWIKAAADDILGAILYMAGMAMHVFFEALKLVKDGLTLPRSEGADVDTLAANVGLRRPTLDVFTSDDKLKAYVQEMGWQPKTVIERFHRLLEVILGPKADAGWEIYEPRPRTVVIELNEAPLGAEFRTYLASKGVASPAAVAGDYLVSVGKPTPGQVSGVGPAHTGVFFSGARIAVFDEIFDLAKAAGINVQFVRKGD